MSKTSNCSATLPLKTPLKALSLFSRGMGLELGLEQQGIEILLAHEADLASRNTIKFNRPSVALIENIQGYSAAEIRKTAGLNSSEEIDLIIGNPICYEFSYESSSIGDIKKGLNENYNPFVKFVNIVTQIRPRFAVIEGDTQLLDASFPDRSNSIEKATYSTLREEADSIIHKLREAGYGVCLNLYNTADFGSAQQQKRVIITCNREGRELPCLSPTHTNNSSDGIPKWKTLRDAIGEFYSDKHNFLKLSERQKKYYRSLKPGENWQNLPMGIQQEAIQEFRTYCLDNKIQKTNFYRRLAWDESSPVFSRWQNMLVHPEADRYLSVEEYKRIKELPHNWEIQGDLISQYQQVARATSSSLGRAIAKMLLNYLEQEESISRTQQVNAIFDRIKNLEEWGKEVNSSGLSELRNYEKYWQVATHKFFLLNEVDSEIEALCINLERADLLVRSMNMIIEFKSEFNKRNLRGGVDQLNGYAEDPKINAKRKVLIGLSPKAEPKRIAIIEEIKKLESENVNLEIYMHNPETEKFDLYKILKLDREKCSDLEKKIIEIKQTFFEWIFTLFTKVTPYYLNMVDDCITEAVYAVGGLLNPSSQVQLNSSQ